MIADLRGKTTLDPRYRWRNPLRMMGPASSPPTRGLLHSVCNSPNRSGSETTRVDCPSRPFGSGSSGSLVGPAVLRSSLRIRGRLAVRF